MALKIPSAETSPRNDNGILKFYEGDTFVFSLTLDLQDQDGLDIELNGETDSAVVTFRDYKNRVIRTFEYGEGYDGVIGTGNILEIEFTDTVSELFSRGKYSYDCYVDIDGIGRRTVISDASVIVE